MVSHYENDAQLHNISHICVLKLEFYIYCTFYNI